MDNDIECVLFSEEQIQARINKLSAQITRDYQEQRLTVVSILTGSIIFAVDLFKKLNLYAEMDFIDVSSYYGDTASSGQVMLMQDLKCSIKDKNVLIVEDIVDTGKTLKFLMELLKDRGAASIKVCSLFSKPEGREIAVSIDYVGFEAPNKFLVGYGLDYQNYYRNLPYVGVLKPAVYR